MQEFHTGIEMYGIYFSVFIRYGYKDGYEYKDWELTGPEAICMDHDTDFIAKIDEAILKHKMGKIGK